MVTDKLIVDGGHCPEWLCVDLRLNHRYHPELDDMPLWWPTITDDQINIYRWPSGDGYGKQLSSLTLLRPFKEQNEGYYTLREDGVFDSGGNLVADGVPCVVRFDRFRPTFLSAQKALLYRNGQWFTVLGRFSCDIVGYHIRFDDGEELDAWCGEVCMPDNQKLYNKVLEEHDHVYIS